MWWNTAVQKKRAYTSNLFVRCCDLLILMIYCKYTIKHGYKHIFCCIYSYCTVYINLQFYPALVYKTENFIVDWAVYHINKNICIDIQVKLDIESRFLTLLLSYTFDFLLDDLIICSIASHISSGTFFNWLNSPAKLLNSPPSNVILSAFNQEA